MPASIDFWQERLFLFVNRLTEERAYQGKPDPGDQREVIGTAFAKAKHGKEESIHRKAGDGRESIRSVLDRIHAKPWSRIINIEKLIPERIPIVDLAFEIHEDGPTETKDKNRRPQAKLDPFGAWDHLYQSNENTPHPKNIEHTKDDADVQGFSESVRDEIETISKNRHQAGEEEDLPPVPEIVARKGARNSGHDEEQEGKGMEKLTDGAIEIVIHHYGERRKARAGQLIEVDKISPQTPQIEDEMIDNHPENSGHAKKIDFPNTFFFGGGRSNSFHLCFGANFSTHVLWILYYSS